MQPVLFKRCVFYFAKRSREIHIYSWVFSGFNKHLNSDCHQPQLTTSQLVGKYSFFFVLPKGDQSLDLFIRFVKSFKRHMRVVIWPYHGHSVYRKMAADLILTRTFLIHAFLFLFWLLFCFCFIYISCKTNQWLFVAAAHVT